MVIFYFIFAGSNVLMDNKLPSYIYLGQETGVQGCTVQIHAQEMVCIPGVQT